MDESGFAIRDVEASQRIINTVDSALGCWSFWSKTLMASAIEPLICTELHRILKAEWLSAYVEAHDNAFSTRNIQAGFRGTGIIRFDPSKVFDRIQLPIQECIQIRGSTSLELATPFKNSVLISSPLNSNDARSENAALLSELSSGGALSTPTLSNISIFSLQN